MKVTVNRTSEVGSPRRDVRSLPLPELAAVLVALISLLGGSIALWATTNSFEESALLGLFAIAGGTGGCLRSFAYLLGFGSFTARERRQWRLEAIIAPVIGSVAGLAAYMIVRASLVDDPSNINRSGQYLLSLAAGTVILQQFGRAVERGLLKGGLSRSGILGGEVAPSVPLLDRLERLLDQRVADLTIVNYEGFALVRTERLPNNSWRLNLWFASELADDHPTDDLALVTHLRVAGGENRDVVPFTVSAISDQFSPIPLVLSMWAPRYGLSDEGTLILQGPSPPAESTQTTFSERHPVSVILEIGQGNQTLQVIPVTLLA
jgi:hypothetical protein